MSYTNMSGLGAVATMGDAEMVQHAGEALSFLGIPMFATTSPNARDQFQARMNLYQGSRGIPTWTTGQTLRFMSAEIGSLYTFFSSMDSIMKAQQALNMLYHGSYNIPATGSMQFWDAPVRKFQQAQRLPITGQFDPATLASLKATLLGQLAVVSYWVARMVQQTSPASPVTAYTAYTAYGR